ncbi:MAG: hypothetical protein LBV67_00560, partial [Streptococcaceae bacterium]|nr:hypothetical protein [Streptococcaceae bacterium]
MKKILIGGLLAFFLFGFAISITETQQPTRMLPVTGVVVEQQSLFDFDLTQSQAKTLAEFKTGLALSVTSYHEPIEFFVPGRYCWRFDWHK